MFDIKKKILDFTERNDNKQVFNGYTIVPASLIKRFGAFLIDSIILSLVLSVILFFVVKDFKKAVFNTDVNMNFEIDMEQETQQMKKAVRKNTSLAVIIFFVPFIYNVLCLKFWKATIGQKLLKLTVVSENFNLTTRDIINRVCLFVIFRAHILILAITYAIALYMTKKFTFYDIFSGTKVIEMNKIGE